MHVAIIIRNVVDCRVPLPVDSYGEQPIQEGLIEIVNPSDWAALEQAIVLKHQGSVDRITVLNVGPIAGEESLRWSLAAGADSAKRLWDSALEHADQLGQGKVMAAALQRLNPDVVMSGDSCLDQHNTLMPGIAAAVAGMTLVIQVENIEMMKDGRVQVVCRREKGQREQVAVRLPALLAFTDIGWESLGRADLVDTIAAFTQVIPCWDLTDLGLSAETVGGRGAKLDRKQIRPQQPPYTKPLTPDPHLSAEQRLRQILTGGVVRKQGEIASGELEILGDKIVEFLYRESVIGR